MTIIGFGVLAASGIILILWVRAKRDRRLLARYSINAEDLHALIATNRDILLYDVRQPLDVLTDAERIPGSRRIAPKEIQANADLVPRDKDVFVYCTCPSDKTSQAITRRALSRNFFRVKFLKGGIAAWKEKGYPVEPYRESFHLDTAS